MSAQSYWNNNAQGSGQYQNYGQPQHGQGQDGYPSQYGQDQSYQSHQPSGNNQGNEPLNWGYGSGNQQHQPPPQTHDYYDSQTSASYTTQHSSSHEQHQVYHEQQGYSQPYQSQPQLGPGYQGQQHGYDYGRQSPQPPHYGAEATGYNRQASPNPYQSSHYSDHSLAAQGVPPQTYPGGPGQAEGDRGLLGAIGGAAAGGFAGHKMNHGIIGTLGGAYAGHKLEDKLKDKKKKDKKDKYGHGRRDSSSSSSSDSSDDEKKRHKKYGVAAAGGAAAYAHHDRDQSHGQATAGNFSASSQQISLDRDFDLIASCATIGGGHNLSSIDLNDCLTNSWGQLQWARGGGFGGSSRNVRLVDGGRVLEAELGDGRGGWNVSRIRLDERITNNNGDLQFLS